jgi:NADPH:quinone reductase-like Zn-dependent oxidoreductase
VRAFAVTDRDAAAGVAELPDPQAGPGQVLVRVRAASVNGFDVHEAAGAMWDMLPTEFPAVIGRDAAGEIAAVGDGVEGFAVGDRVLGVITDMALGRGTIAELVALDTAALAKLPAGVDEVTAAALGLVGVSALDLLAALDLREGETVLVSGATGGIGSFLIQLATAAGFRVIATARTPEGASFVTKLGAAATVDPSDLATEVRAAEPEGVNAVVHLAGDPAELAAVLAPGGRMASVAGADQSPAGRHDVTVTPVLAVATTDKLDSLLTAVAEGRLTVAVHGTYPLDQAADALAAFGGSKLGKLVVTID